ncbi:MAG: DUF302 domain-containing protein [Planctomycetota bacterium]
MAQTKDPVRYVVTTEKSPDTAQKDLEAAVAERKFSVLHVYDLKATLKEKGVDLREEARVLEICNASQADKVLRTDIGMNLALPCRVSIWQQDGSTWIGMVRPKAMLRMLSDSKPLQAIADEVERTLIEIVEAAR